MAVEEPLRSPHRGFPAWLGTRGLSPEIALAMDTELGIRDYEVLLACAEDLQVRSELFCVARERLPFGFYAVLRRVVAAFPAERAGDGAGGASGRPCPGLGSLLEALVGTLSGLSRELLRSADRLSALDVGAAREADGDCGAGGERAEEAPPGQRKRRRRGSTPRYPEVAEQGLEEVCEMPAEEVDDDDEEEEDVEVPSGWRINQVAETYPKLPADSAPGPLVRMSEMLTSATDDTSPQVVEVSRSELEAGQVVVKAENVDEGGWGREPERIWNPASAIYIQQQHAAATADTKPGGNLRRTPAPARNPSRGADRPLSHPYPLPARELGETGGGTHHHHHRAVIAARPGAPDGGDPAAAAAAAADEWNGQLVLGPGGGYVDGGGGVGGGNAAGGQFGRSASRCEECGKEFSTPSYLTIHRRTHTGERPYNCEFCGRSFGHLAVLTSHRRRHTGEKPFTCKVCGKAFCQNSSLVYHMRTHTGEKPYTCDVCGRKFTVSSNFIKHRRSHF